MCFLDENRTDIYLLRILIAIGRREKNTPTKRRVCIRSIQLKFRMQFYFSCSCSCSFRHILFFFFFCIKKFACSRKLVFDKHKRFLARNMTSLAFPYKIHREFYLYFAMQLIHFCISRSFLFI